MVIPGRGNRVFIDGQKMSDTADMLRFIESYSDSGGFDIICEPWDVVEVVDDHQNVVAWVGPMVQTREGHS